MEDIYSFTLDSETFDRVLSGKKTVQIVLNDSKHKVYEVGNELEFIRKVENAEDDKDPKTVKANIENLLYFANLNDLFDTLGKEKCGYKPSSTTEKASDTFLSHEKYELIEKNGLIAVVFKINK